MGTFSKTMFPALRVGYLIVPSSLVDVVPRRACRLRSFLAERRTGDVRRVHREAAISPRTCVACVASTRRARKRCCERWRRAGRPSSSRSRPTRECTSSRGCATRTIDDALVSRLAAAAGVEVAPLSMYSNGRDTRTRAAHGIRRHSTRRDACRVAHRPRPRYARQCENAKLAHAVVSARETRTGCHRARRRPRDSHRRSVAR